jgi:hypothetical protein
MMWTSDQIIVEIEDVEHPVVEVVIITPVGTVSLMRAFQSSTAFCASTKHMLGG